MCCRRELITALCDPGLFGGAPSIVIRGLSRVTTRYGCVGEPQEKENYDSNGVVVQPALAHAPFVLREKSPSVSFGS